MLEWLEKERKDVKSLEHEKEKEPVLSLEKAWMHYHAEKVPVLKRVMRFGAA